MDEKKILDATCGPRMMWYDKKHPDVLYCDNRTFHGECSDGRMIDVDPDMEVDFTDMPFEDERFWLVVFDPPHLNDIGKNAYMAQKYGRLLPTWQTDIRGGFDECMRVLKPNGTLIFKWSEAQIKINDVIDAIECKPLFGHRTNKNAIWMTFMKQLG